MNPLYLETIPPSVLRGIIERVQAELAEQKARQSLADLQRIIRDAPPPLDFHSALVSADFSMIAEVKRRSPSGGEMRCQDYLHAGRLYDESSAVSAISVLTNRSDFGMEIGALSEMRKMTRKPLLRKDFILDEYQVFQARAYGADAILLMANVLSREGMHVLSRLAAELGMDVLYEAHDPDEVRKFPPDARICGLNSRKFVAKDFSSGAGAGEALLSSSHTDFSTNANQFGLIECLPPESVKVAESGLRPDGVAQVWKLGFDCILVGATLLMDPAGVAASLRSFEKTISLSRSGEEIPG